jgi:hypothetical protein
VSGSTALLARALATRFQGWVQESNGLTRAARIKAEPLGLQDLAADLIASDAAKHLRLANADLERRPDT